VCVCVCVRVCVCECVCVCMVVSMRVPVCACVCPCDDALADLSLARARKHGALAQAPVPRHVLCTLPQGIGTRMSMCMCMCHGPVQIRPCSRRAMSPWFSGRLLQTHTCGWQRFLFLPVLASTAVLCVTTAHRLCRTASLYVCDSCTWAVHATWPKGHPLQASGAHPGPPSPTPLPSPACRQTCTTKHLPTTYTYHALPHPPMHMRSCAQPNYARSNLSCARTAPLAWYASRSSM